MSPPGRRCGSNVTWTIICPRLAIGRPVFHGVILHDFREEVTLPGVDADRSQYRGPEHAACNRDRRPPAAGRRVGGCGQYLSLKLNDWPVPSQKTLTFHCPPSGPPGICSVPGPVPFRIAVPLNGSAPPTP